MPSYDPAVVWGTPYYPYPAMAYPCYPAGGMLLGFGVGVAMGAAWGGGGWGWNTGWGGNNDININRNNTFVNNYNRAGGTGMVARMVRGSTIPNIAEALRTLTVQPQTGMAAQPAAMP